MVLTTYTFHNFNGFNDLDLDAISAAKDVQIMHII